MKNIFNIVKKELDKIFKSPRLIFSTFILPGLLIFVMYSFMGSSAKTQQNKNYEHEYNIVFNGVECKQLESELNNIYYDKNKKFNITITYNSEDQLENLKQEKVDLVITYDNNINEILDKTITEGNPNIKISVYSGSTYSTFINQIVTSKLNEMETKINPTIKYVLTPNITDVATDSERSSIYLGMLAPMLIMTFIFAGALSIGADSIAGEKERGTIATMLMAPISKNEIVLGKIISAIIITIIAALCSFIGLIGSLSQLSSVMGDAAETGISMSITFGSAIQMLVLIVLISLIAVSLFLVASTFAKSTKEATMYAMPVYLIGIISGVFTMFETTVPTSILPYIIPIYNLTLGLKGVFIGSLFPSCFFTILLSNIVYFVVILVVVKKMFSSERIMFAR